MFAKGPDMGAPTPIANSYPIYVIMLSKGKFLTYNRLLPLFYSPQTLREVDINQKQNYSQSYNPKEWVLLRKPGTLAEIPQILISGK